MTREYTEDELNILKTSLDYPEQHVYDQLEITASLKENESRQVCSMSVIHYNDDRCYDGKKLRDHTSTHSISCQSLREKLKTLTTDDFMQFMNEMEIYSFKNKEMQKDRKKLFCIFQKLAPKSRVVPSVE